MSDFAATSSGASGETNDASTLDFGHLDMSNISILSTVEVLAITSKTKSSSSEDDYTDVFNKVHKYSKRFSSLRGAIGGADLDLNLLSSSLDALRSTLLNRTYTDQSTGTELTLHQFEAVQLINLMTATSTPDEAIVLIPSLSRFGEARVGEFLEIVQKCLRQMAEKSV